MAGGKSLTTMTLPLTKLQINTQHISLWGCGNRVEMSPFYIRPYITHWLARKGDTKHNLHTWQMLECHKYVQSKSREKRQKTGTAHLRRVRAAEGKINLFEVSHIRVLFVRRSGGTTNALFQYHTNHTNTSVVSGPMKSG